MWIEKTAPNSSESPSIRHGGSTSSTSWPSERSSSAASATACAHIGSTTASAIGEQRAGRDPQPARVARARHCANGSERRRRPGGVARLVAREHVEDRGGVGDGAGQHAVDAQRGVAEFRRAARSARALASARPARSMRPGCGSSRRRRCRARPAPCPRRPPRPRRPRSRRACARDPTGCAWARTRAPR